MTNNGHPCTLASRATSSPTTTSSSYRRGCQRARRHSRQRGRGSPARACAPTAVGVATPARQPAARRAARSTGPRRRAYIPPFSGAVLDFDGRGRHGGARQAPQPRAPGCARAMKRPVGARRSSSGIRWPLSPPTHQTRHRCNRYASAQEMKCGCVSYVQVGLAPVTKGVPLQGTAHRQKRKDAHKDYETTHLQRGAHERVRKHYRPPKKHTRDIGPCQRAPAKKKQRHAPSNQLVGHGLAAACQSVAAPPPTPSHAAAAWATDTRPPAFPRLKSCPPWTCPQPS